MEENVILHYGIFGMRWGVRRYQNKDGTLTAAGKKRYLDQNGELNERGKKELKKYTSDKESQQKAKKATEMTDQELQESINRLRMEREYKDLMKNLYPPKKTYFDGKAFAAKILNDSGTKLATSLLTYIGGTTINSLFNANVVDTKNKEKKS